MSTWNLMLWWFEHEKSYIIRRPDHMTSNQVFSLNLQAFPPFAEIVIATVISGWLFVCLFDLILYVPVNIFRWCRDGSSWVEQPVLSKDKFVCLAKGHKTVTLVRLEPAAPRSRVKHSTTEPLCSQIVDVNVWSCTDACARMRACVCVWWQLGSL